jgi:hypothetical protein
VLQGIDALTYVDNVALAAASFEQYLSKLDSFLRRCAERRVLLKPSDAVVCAPGIDFCGFSLNAHGWRRVTLAFQQAPPLSLVTGAHLTNFVGFVNYHGSHIPRLQERLAPFRNALTQVESTAGKTTSAALEKIVLATHPAWSASLFAAALTLYAEVFRGLRLAFPRPGWPLALFSDASVSFLSFALFQFPPGQIDTPPLERAYEPLAFGSARLTETEARWSIVEKEFEAMYRGVLEAQVYASGHPIYAYTDA